MVLASLIVSGRMLANWTESRYAEIVPDRGLGQETEKPSRLTAGDTRNFDKSIFAGTKYKLVILGIEAFSTGWSVLVVAISVMKDAVKLVSVILVWFFGTRIGPFGMTFGGDEEIST